MTMRRTAMIMKRKRYISEKKNRTEEREKSDWRTVRKRNNQLPSELNTKIIMDKKEREREKAKFWTNRQI